MPYDHERREHASTTVATPPKPYSASYPPPDHDGFLLMACYLGTRGLNFDLAIENGWYPSSQAGDDTARVVIPAFSYQEGNRYWQARALMSGAPVRYQSPHGVSRGDAFVRVCPASVAKGLVIAEGPMDALAAAECGCVGIGLMGAQPPAAVISAISRYRGGMGWTIPVIIVSDEGALGAATKVWRNFPGATLVATYPYKDLACVPLDERWGILSE